MTRRDRVMMLKANCIGSWWTYCARFSNHSRLACAARWVESTTALRSTSYVASAAVVSGSSCRQAARASASSIASFVPEPIEKWAVCAASPRITTAPLPGSAWTQCSLRTVVNEIQRELLAITSWPPRMSSNSSRISAIDFSSDSPGAQSRSAKSAKPARRQTSLVISTMNVEPVASNG